MELSEAPEDRLSLHAVSRDVGVPNIVLVTVTGN